MEYIIYCDESVSDGIYYTDFFGGVLVCNTDYDVIKDALNAKKLELNLHGEIKWVKVTGNDRPVLLIYQREQVEGSYYVP